MLIKYGLQPALIVGVLALWSLNQEALWVFPLVLFGLQLLLGVLEYLFPARPDWVQAPREKAILVTVFIAVGYFGAVVTEPLYAQSVEPALESMRQRLGIDIWPHEWPIIPQVLLAFFLSEFIWYWIHRAEHRWSWVWRVTGHGSHHAFKNLGAINAGANHPLQYRAV